MVIKSEPVAVSQRLWLWALGVCALTAGAVALVLAWQNAELETQLDALRREKQMGAESITPQTQPSADPLYGKAVPAGSNQRPVQDPAATTAARDEAARTPAAHRELSTEAIRNAEETVHDQYPYATSTQSPGNGGLPMSTLDAFKVSEEALIRNYRDQTNSTYPFSARK